MKEYDIAAKNFYSKQVLKTYPLEAWDLFSSNFNRLCRNLDEVKAIKDLANSNNWKDTSFFEKEILEKNLVVVITDVQLNIVHASEDIYSMNGYHSSEVIGKKPKIFQGEKTCVETTKRIRTAITRQEPFEATILNYRKDGSTYNCWIKGAPIRNEQGQVVNFVAFEREVA